MLTLCLLFYARAMVYSVAVSLAFTSSCRRKKCHIMHHMKFVRILQVLSCILYADNLTIIYAADDLQLTLSTFVHICICT